MTAIRLAAPSDAEAVKAFMKTPGIAMYSPKTIQRMVCGDNEGRKPYIIGLAFVNENIVGIAIVSSKSRTLSLLHVLPEFRNMGIGKMLLDATAPEQYLIKRSSVGYFWKVLGCHQ